MIKSVTLNWYCILWNATPLKNIARKKYTENNIHLCINISTMKNGYNTKLTVNAFGLKDHFGNLQTVTLKRNVVDAHRFMYIQSYGFVY